MWGKYFNRYTNGHFKNVNSVICFCACALDTSSLVTSVLLVTSVHVKIFLKQFMKLFIDLFSDIFKVTILLQGESNCCAINRSDEKL